MKRLCVLSLTLTVILLILTFTVSCGKPDLSGWSTSDYSGGLSGTTTQSESVPPLTGGLTKPPQDTSDGITSLYRPKPDPALVLERQEKVLSSRDNKTPYDEMITKTMDVNAFFDKCYGYNMTAGGVTQGSKTLSEIDEAFGVECLRKNEAGNYYSVHKIKQGGLLYIFYRLNSYQSSGFYDVFDWFVTQKKLSYKDFSSVEKGDPYEDVEAVDPAADIFEQRLLSYMEKTSEKTTTFFVTQHYLTDGILTVHYEFINGDCIVQFIKHHSDFQADLLFASSYPRYNGRILDIDAIQ